MVKSLMETQIKGQAEGGLEGTDQQANGAPTMTPKVRGFTLSFRVLVEGDDTGHAAPILGDIRVIRDDDEA